MKPGTQIVLKLSTTNDTNGNPRRVYVVFDQEGNIVEALDEGYADEGRSLANRMVYLGRFKTTPGEYRSVLKAYSNRT